MKRNPRVFFGRLILPTYKVVVAVTCLAAIEYVRDEGGVVGELKRFGCSVGVEFGWVGVGFEKGCVEDGVESRQIWWEAEKVGVVANFANDREWSKAAVVELQRRSSGADVTAKKPGELVRLVFRGRKDMLVELVLLALLRKFELSFKLSVNVVETLSELIGGRDSGYFGEFGSEGGVESAVGEKGVCLVEEFSVLLNTNSASGR